MLRSLFPTTHVRYSSLSILGGSLDGLCAWLHAQGYPREALRRRVRAAVPLERALHRQGVRSLGQLTASALNSYIPRSRRSSGRPLGAMVRSLTRYLEERGELAPTSPTPTQLRVTAYRHHLERVRGLAPSTITLQVATVREFLLFLDYDAQPHRLRALRSTDVEAFVAKVSRRVGRGRLSSVTSTLRAFLRFLAATGEGPQGLDMHVDSPRVFRGERLPRALPWETVRAFLAAIDRASFKGRRDYAIFLLIATYGLRAGEVCSLTLDDIAWRERQIRVSRSKTGAPLVLPLTDEAASAVLEYVRRGRPEVTSRRLFLRVEAPVGPLGSGAIWNAFTRWARCAQVVLPSRGGPHCLRHSFAMRLLRQGTPLKTIGDLLGHRSVESTSVYVRLDAEDLREVGLPLPSQAEAVQP